MQSGCECSHCPPVRGYPSDTDTTAPTFIGSVSAARANRDDFISSCS